MPTILLTNDDGYSSYGLRRLARELKELGDIIVVCPDRPRSASGFSLTLEEPIRIKHRHFDSIPYYLVSGTPGDCVALGLFHLIKEKPNIVVSGINIGENISVLEFFMSGTLAGAIAAALYGVPSLAFSKVVPGKDVMIVEEVRDEFDIATKIAKEMVRYFLFHELPGNSDLVSINFPAKFTENTKVKFTRMARISLRVKVYERRDPRGTPYYWIWGDKFKIFPKLTDAQETLINGDISVTPIKLESLSIPPDDFKEIEDNMNEIVWRVLNE